MGTGRGAWLLLCVAVGCGDDGGGADGGGPERDGGAGRDAGPGEDAGRNDGGGGSDGGTPSGVQERARVLARELRGDAHFLFGMGNDLDGETFDPDRAGAFTLGETLDVHYMYLVGTSDRGGWPTWNSDGSFVTIHADAAERHGTTVMYTYYQLALDYETGADTLRDADRMRVWLEDVRLLFERLGETDRPAIVHFEPDLFGYLQQRMGEMGTTPDRYEARLHHDSVPECGSVPETAAGLGACLVALRDALAPRTRIGLHASQWADWYDVTDAGADIEGRARSIASFLRAMGGGLMDLVVVETLDRDAGFWEAYGGSPMMCSLDGGPRGPVYWDESNATLPSFEQHFRWVAALTEELGLPALWWQMPFGVPAESCGGSDGRWRDNRVRYFFSHVADAVAAGGVGAVFGTGAGGQTYITSDDGQFQRAVTAYFAAPHPL